MESIFTDMSRRVSSKNYTGDQASLEAYSVVTKQLVSWCQDRGSDHTVPDAYVNLMERAIQAGKGQADLACLFEILSATSISGGQNFNANKIGARLTPLPSHSPANQEITVFQTSQAPHIGESTL